MSRETSPVQAQIAESMRESAVIQAATNELFQVYPANSNNPELEFLKVSTRWPKYSRSKGNPEKIPNIELDVFAMTIQPTYEALYGSYHTNPAVDQIALFMAGHNHVALGNSHGNLFDTPMDLQGVSSSLRESGIPHRTALIAAKGIDYLGVSVEALGGPDHDSVKWMIKNGVRILVDQTIPARDVLSLITNRLYFTIPPSRSFEGLREAEEALKFIRRFNGLSRLAIAGSMRLPKPPLLLAEGISGTKIKDLDIQTYVNRTNLGIPYDTEPATFDVDRRVRIIGKISSASVDLIKGMYFFPTATNLEVEPPRVMFGQPIFMDGKHDARDVGKLLVALEEQIHPESPAVYDAIGKLPIK